MRVRAVSDAAALALATASKALAGRHGRGLADRRKDGRMWLYSATDPPSQTAGRARGPGAQVGRAGPAGQVPPARLLSAHHDPFLCKPDRDNRGQVYTKTDHDVGPGG